MTHRFGIDSLMICLSLAMGCESKQDDATAQLNLPVPSKAAAAGDELPAIDQTQLDPAVATAIAQAMDAVRQAPHAADRWGKLGMLLLAHDLFDPAAQCLDRAGVLNSQEPRWPYFEAIARRPVDPAAAVDRLRIAVPRFGEQSVLPRTRLAEWWVEDEQLDDAEALLDELIRAPRNNPRAHLAHAKLRLLRNQPDKALESIERARKSMPPTRMLLLLSAETHRQLGDLDAANQASEAARTAPESSWDDPLYDTVRELRTGLKAKLSEADRRFQQNDVDGSMRILEQLVQDYPDSEWALILLARAQIRKRQLEAAEDSLKEVLRLNPNSFQAHFRLGVVCQIRGQHEQAIQWFEKTLQIQPSSAVALRNAAMSRVLLGDRAGAERDFRRAVEIQPNYYDGHLALAHFYLQSQDLAAAKASLRSTQRLWPGDSNVAQMLDQVERALRNEP